MNAYLTCFLLGFVAAVILGLSVRRGVLPGGKWLWVFNIGWVHRSVHPVRFWKVAALLAFFPLALMVMPILHWLGLRG